jgi:hypothetical protein
MFGKSPGDVIPRMRTEIGVKRSVLPIFSINKTLLTAEFLPKGQKYNHDYFISDGLPD